MKKHLTTAAKAQLSAFIGGMVDYGVMILLTELGLFHYSFSIVVSGFIGAIVNFTINRHWTFKASAESKSKQIPRFAVMVLGSVLLKSIGTTVVTEFYGMDYKISRLLVDAVVSVGFNFMLQRFWVFRIKKNA